MVKDAIPRMVRTYTFNFSEYRNYLIVGTINPQFRWPFAAGKKQRIDFTQADPEELHVVWIDRMFIKCFFCRYGSLKSCTVRLYCTVQDVNFNLQASERSQVNNCLHIFLDYLWEFIYGETNYLQRMFFTGHHPEFGPERDRTCALHMRAILSSPPSRKCTSTRSRYRRFCMEEIVQNGRSDRKQNRSKI